MRSAIIMIGSRKGGHKFPAAAIANSINTEYKTQTCARVINFLDHFPLMSFFDRLGRWGDLNIKFAWRAGYAGLTDKNSFFVRLYRQGIRMIIGQPRIEKKLREVIGDIDIIVSMQPEINAIAGIMKEWFSVPFHTLIMDYSAHAGWADPDIDRYYVVNNQVRQQMIDYGVLPTRIVVTGAPAQPGYDIVAQIPIEKQRRLLGIDPGLPTVLVMAGYLGKMVDYIGIIHSLKKNIPDIQILVVTGKNKRMHHRLIKFAYPNIFPYYNIPSIHPVMRAVDLVISKPGGMVIADCLAHGKPMLLVDPRGGALQELIFASMIEKAGAGRHLTSIQEIGKQTRDLFRNRKGLETMAEKSFSCGRLNRSAAMTVAKEILDELTIGSK